MLQQNNLPNSADIMEATTNIVVKMVSLQTPSNVISNNLPDTADVTEAATSSAVRMVSLQPPPGSILTSARQK